MRSGQPENSLHIWDGFLLFASHEIVNTYHAHYAASIVIATGTPERPIRIENEFAERSTYGAVIIPPNFPHRLSAPGTDVVVLQIDPDLDEAAAIASGADRDELRPASVDIADIKNLSERVARLLYEAVDCAEALSLAREILTAARNPNPCSRKLDSRVESVLQHLRALEEIPVDINTDEMARLVGLSEERFRTIFRQHMGLRFRRYLLWLRLRRAAVLLSDGRSLTDTAHAAGFYDSAHFSRTFREMFGHAPSDLLGQPRRLRIRCC